MSSLEPPCFDRARPDGDCGAAQRLDLPLRYWPTLGSGGPDLVINRQIGQRGQCQHFMADTADSRTPVDPHYGVPGGLVTEAYIRCVHEAGLVFDGILRDPRLAEWRLAGTYVLMHALEDSYSAAHVDRRPQLEIVHLLSWTLIDWPIYALHGEWGFPASTHHAISDRRDYDYVRWDAHTRDGRACRDLHHPYAFPEECLTERAKAAAATVVDFLVLTYRLRARALAEGRAASLFAPAPSRRRRALDGLRDGRTFRAWRWPRTCRARRTALCHVRTCSSACRVWPGRTCGGRGSGARGSSWDQRRRSFWGSGAPPGSTAATAPTSWWGLRS